MPARFDISDLQQALSRIRQDLSDLSPLLERVRDEVIILQIENIFSTDGLGTWDSTSRPNPILRDTGALYDSVTDSGSAVFDIDADSLSISPSVYYHEWHEGGWDEYNVRFPPRPVLRLLDTDDPEIENIVQEYIDDIADRHLTPLGI